MLEFPRLPLATRSSTAERASGSNAWTVTSAERCWVDPQRDDLIVSFGQAPRGYRDAPTFRYSISYREIPQFGWIPERWVCRHYSGDQELQCQVTASAVNQQLPADAFQIDCPPGTTLVDVAAHKEYVIAANGSRTPAPPFETVSSPKFRKALDQVEPFTISAEPIQDALLFLSFHHKLPIDCDRAARSRRPA